MAKNQYAAKLIAAKGAVNKAERERIVHHCVTTQWLASAIALNRAFGFGPERIEKFRDELESVMVEYDVARVGADVDYADGKLEESFANLMKRRCEHERNHCNQSE